MSKSALQRVVWFENFQNLPLFKISSFEITDDYDNELLLYLKYIYTMQGAEVATVLLAPQEAEVVGWNEPRSMPPIWAIYTFL